MVIFDNYVLMQKANITHVDVHLAFREPQSNRSIVQTNFLPNFN